MPHFPSPRPLTLALTSRAMSEVMTCSPAAGMRMSQSAVRRFSEVGVAPGNPTIVPCSWWRGWGVVTSPRARKWTDQFVILQLLWVDAFLVVNNTAVFLGHTHQFSSVAMEVATRVESNITKPLRAKEEWNSMWRCQTGWSWTSV